MERRASVRSVLPREDDESHDDDEEQLCLHDNITSIVTLDDLSIPKRGCIVKASVLWGAVHRRVFVEGLHTNLRIP